MVETVEKKPLRVALSHGLYLPHKIERLLNSNFGYRFNSCRMRSITLPLRAMSMVGFFLQFVSMLFEVLLIKHLKIFHSWPSQVFKLLLYISETTKRFLLLTLMNSSPQFDYTAKQSVFFSKSVKRGVRVLSARSVRASHARKAFSASFQIFCLTARAYLNTQKYGLFCSLHFNPMYCLLAI